MTCTIKATPPSEVRTRGVLSFSVLAVHLQDLAFLHIISPPINVFFPYQILPFKTKMPDPY